MKKENHAATQKPQHDPWLNWCGFADVDAVDRLDFLDDQEEFLNCIKEFSSNRLLDAELAISNEASEFVVEPEHVKIHPVRALETLEILTDEYSPYDGGRIVVPLTELLCTDLYRTLRWSAAAGALPEVVLKLKELAPKLIRLLLAVKKLGKKKLVLAEAMRLNRVSGNLRKAYKDFCLIELTGDIDEDSKRLAKQIKPEVFRNVICRALRLDREATEAINHGANDAKPSAMPRRRYPTDTEALALLKEAARRKRTPVHKDDSNETIIRTMVEEPQSKWKGRIVYGKKSGKADGGAFESGKSRPFDKEIKNWGKYLSAYILSHPTKS